MFALREVKLRTYMQCLSCLAIELFLGKEALESCFAVSVLEPFDNGCVSVMLLMLSIVRFSLKCLQSSNSCHIHVNMVLSSYNIKLSA